MKLITNTQITVDGVMQANGGNNPSSTPDSTEAAGRCRWVTRSRPPTSASSTSAPTHSCSAGAPMSSSPGTGGCRDDLDNPFVGALNSRPKFVASNTITDPEWADTTVLSGDLEAAIRELKAKPGGELQVHGSGQLIRWLLEHELVDEMTLIVCPVIVGAGTRLFPEAGRDFALDLLESRRFPTGILAQTYRPVGRPQYA